MLFVVAVRARNSQNHMTMPPTFKSFAMAASLLAASLQAQPTVAPATEVRQIVTFLFQPGRSAEAIAIYESQLKPIYTGVAPLRRFRAYREAESPEPLDLVVISSYTGMNGMDAANAALRTPPASGRSAFTVYGALAAMSQSHHDQFVEILPALSDTPDDSAGLTVFEYLRVVPGAQERFSTLLFTGVRRREREADLYRWSETGRMLVSDGWDFLRIHHLRTLGDWQRFLTVQRSGPLGAAMQPMIAARKTLILRQEPRLSVR